MIRYLDGLAANRGLPIVYYSKKPIRYKSHSINIWGYWSSRFPGSDRQVRLRGVELIPRHGVFHPLRQAVPYVRYREEQFPYEDSACQAGIARRPSASRSFRRRWGWLSLSHPNWIWRSSGSSAQVQNNS